MGWCSYWRGYYDQVLSIRNQNAPDRSERQPRSDQGSPGQSLSLRYQRRGADRVATHTGGRHPAARPPRALADDAVVAEDKLTPAHKPMPHADGSDSWFILAVRATRVSHRTDNPGTQRTATATDMSPMTWPPNALAA